MDSRLDRRFMTEALALARQAEAHGEVPVGAVVVRDGEIIGSGFNRCITDHDPTAHAEVVALRTAAGQVTNYRLPDATLYVTLEPCCMCAGAIIHARLRRVVYGASDPKTGAAGSVFDVLTSNRHNHTLQVASGLFAERSAQYLQAFFSHRRGG